jgi:hypothetical protein
MGNFLDTFPKVIYDINKAKITNYDLVTNIFFRLGIIKEVLDNTSAYYVYTIKETDKPEILADNIYRDPEAHWIILLANDMIDPQYDWPMNYMDFENYIINKYGSIATAQSTTHHYEKVTQRQAGLTNQTIEFRQKIDYANTTNTVSDSYHYDYYAGLADSEYNTYSVANTTVYQIVSRQAISCYDYEYNLNESKRTIKIIKPEYYVQIMGELKALTNSAAQPFIRRLV